MLKNNSFFLGYTFLLLLAVAPHLSSAQESGSPSFEAYENLPDDREWITPGDTVNASRLKKDSIAARQLMKRSVYKPAPAVPKDKDQSDKDSDDNSTLSFNFLYYLIQKYKMQDIVD